MSEIASFLLRLFEKAARKSLPQRLWWNMASDAELLQESAKRLDIKTIVITMILSALGFLVALAWRDAIQQTIDLLVPKGEGLSYTYIAAMMVTIIAVVVTIILIKLQKIDLIPEAKLKERIRKPEGKE